MLQIAMPSTARSFEPSALAAALNDASLTRIGNPRRGSYYLSIALRSDDERGALIAELDELGVDYQVNTRRRDGQLFVAVYSVAGLRTMLEQLGPELAPGPRDELDTLVRARSPIPDEIVQGILDRYNLDGWSAERIADAMNAKPIIDGMGKGWNARKVNRILRRD